jgi:hypothetical protein
MGSNEIIRSVTREVLFLSVIFTNKPYIVVFTSINPIFQILFINYPFSGVIDELMLATLGSSQGLFGRVWYMTLTVGGWGQVRQVGGQGATAL